MTYREHPDGIIIVETQVVIPLTDPTYQKWFAKGGTPLPSDLPAIQGFDPSVGVPGATLRIYGRNLTTESQVRFNGNLVSCIRTNPIVFIIPPGEGDVKITIENPSGPSNTVVFKYEPT